MNTAKYQNMTAVAAVKLGASDVVAYYDPDDNTCPYKVYSVCGAARMFYAQYETLSSVLYSFAQLESDMRSEKALDDEDALLPITRNMVRMGYEGGFIRIIDNPMGGEEAVCKIGEFWFFFDGENTENVTAAEYVASKTGDEIVNAVFEALEAFREDIINEDDTNRTEYMYYSLFLRENGVLEL